MEENKIFIDKKVEEIIRNYKIADNILYSFGINNLIFGLIKIKVSSSEDEKLNFEEEININNLMKFIPLGMEINGIFAIYNENTFEDFENILNEEENKIKKILNDENKNFYLFALKELLYLDDYETLNFEYKKYKNFDDDLEIIFKENLINDENNNLFCVFNQIKIVFNENNENFINIENSKEKISFSNEIFCNLLNENENFMIDNINNLNDLNFEHIFNFLEKIKINKNLLNNENILNLKATKIEFGSKIPELKIYNNFNIKDFNIKENEKILIYLESMGIVNLLNKNFKEIFNLIFNKTIENLNEFLSSLNNSKIFTQNRLCYNNLFSSIPFNSIVTTKISIDEENKAISINKNNSIISNQNILQQNYHQTGFNIYSLNILQQPELQEEKSTYIHLKSPHLSLEPSKTSSNSLKAFVKGDYNYYHYNQDNINDAGWGCAYRSLQTLFSWFILNTSKGKGKKVPKIPEIQEILVKIGDKDKSIINSNQWIGAVEVNLVLNELLGIDNQIIYISSGKEMNSKGRELIKHFECNGTPVMIGGGVYAYTILGVDYDRIKGECKFLILDPHYSGEDDLKSIINKGFCAWKGIDLFKKEEFYNMCLPQIN